MILTAAGPGRDDDLRRRHRRQRRRRSLPPAQASNVIPGLTLDRLSSSFGIVKTGVGTLQLGLNATDTSIQSTFGSGTATSIDIQGGIVSTFNDSTLGN